MLAWRVLPKLVIVGFVAYAAAVLDWPLRAISLHIPLSYNEGWNAFHTLRLRSGGDLYPPIAPDIFINYPPLSFYIVGALARLIGDDIIAGRIIATMALAITTLNVGLIARYLGAKSEIAIIAALAFLCFIATFFPEYVGVNDPQWQVQAFQSSGLLVLLSDRRSWRSIAITALLIVLGGLVKHSALIMPVTITLWLLVEDRTALKRWCVSLIAIGALALAICYIAYGHDFIDQLIGFGRTYTLGMASLVLRMLGPQFAAFTMVALIGAMLHRRSPEGRLIGIYVVTSAIGSVLLMTGAGVIYNTLVDLVIAMMLGCALFARYIVERVGITARSAAIATTLTGLLFALRFIMIAPAALHVYDAIPLEAGRLAAWSSIIETIRTTPGPVACETLALCYWAGRHSEVEFFNFGQRARLDPGYDAPLRTKIEAGAIALIQLDLDTGESRLTPALQSLIDEHYVVATSSVAIIKEPR